MKNKKCLRCGGSVRGYGVAAFSNGVVHVDLNVCKEQLKKKEK